MSAVLRVAAGFALIWALLLLGFKERVLAAADLSPLLRALANALGILYLAITYVFWYAAGDPAANRGAIYAAIVFLGLKTGNDLYDLLVLLPPNAALVSLADLVISLALLVAVLQALPRTLASQRRAAPPAARSLRRTGPPNP